MAHKVEEVGALEVGAEAGMGKRQAGHGLGHLAVVSTYLPLSSKEQRLLTKVSFVTEIVQVRAAPLVRISEDVIF